MGDLFYELLHSSVCTVGSSLWLWEAVFGFLFIPFQPGRINCRFSSSLSKVWAARLVASRGCFGVKVVIACLILLHHIHSLMPSHFSPLVQRIATGIMQ